MSIIVPWLVIALILIAVGVVLIVAGVKSRFATYWKVALSVIGVATIGLGLYCLLFLVGLSIP